MKRFKVIVTLLIMALLLKGSMTLASSETNHEDLAELLREAGFFRGSDKGFELERQPSRVECAVMLVRMLGKEEYVLSQDFEHPFQDVPTWADPYIGYLYTYGMTKGIESNKYGSKSIMTVEQYLTFVLRSLGYSDAKGDFNWNKSLEMAYELGILDIADFCELKNSLFLRDQVVLVTYRGLISEVKGQKYKLIEHMVDEEIVTDDVEDLVLDYLGTDEIIALSTIDGLVNKHINSFSDIDKISFTEENNSIVTWNDSSSDRKELIYSKESKDEYDIDFSALKGVGLSVANESLTGKEIFISDTSFFDSGHFYEYSYEIEDHNQDGIKEYFMDYFKDPTYIKEYQRLLSSDVTPVNISDSLVLSSIKNAGIEINETWSSYIISTKNPTMDLIQNVELEDDEIIEVNSFKMVFDKKLGIMSQMVLTYSIISEYGFITENEYIYRVTDLNNSKVIIEMPLVIADQIKNTSELKYITSIGYVSDRQNFFSGMDWISHLCYRATEFRTHGFSSNSLEISLDSINDMAEEGYDLMIILGRKMTERLNEVSQQYPKKDFLMFDGVVQQPNVLSVSFKEEEGSYLVGVAAALKAKEDGESKVGFIGGIEDSITLKCEAGYQAGVKEVDPDIEVYIEYAGNDDESDLGEDLANQLYDRGVYIIYDATYGFTGLGIYYAASEWSQSGNKRWVIGNDEDSYAQGIYSSTEASVTLTSMIKNFQLIAGEAINGYSSGNLSVGQTYEYGLAEGGMYLSQSNTVLTNEMLKSITYYQRKIVDGTILVPTTPER